MREIEKKLLQEGLIFDFVKGKYKDDRIITREFIETKFSAAVVLPIFEGDKIVLVKQFRAPTGGDLLEVPAGKVDPGEEPIHAAVRELHEETGMIAGEISPLGKAYASPGISSELYNFFLATNLTQAEPDPDEDEDVETIIVSIDDFQKMILSGEIVDSKSIAAFGLWKIAAK